MKLLIFVLALSCAIAYASAQETSSKELVQYQLPDPIIPHDSRLRRDAEKGSISFQGTQPLSGPMRQPSWDLNTNRNIYNNGRTTADIYGGMSKVPGQRVQPHFGIQAERNIGKNGFIRGHTQFQPRPGGNGLSPSSGISAGYRFRREAKPQGTSLSFQGTQPLSGPMRQPSWDLNANRNIYNNGRTTADIYGGMSKVPGQRAQPHFGIQAERNIGKNGFIRGHTQFQPRPGGNGLSPSGGISAGYRFRREAEPQGTSLSFQGTQPLSGPMRQPSWDLNANRNIYNNGRTTADVYGGMSKVPRQRVQPHFGVQAERNFGNNGFIRGHTQFQPRPGGNGLSPSVGVSGGFRFRREAEPQGTSLSFQGTQPLSGPMRQPSWDLNANRNIYNNGRTTADVYGGMSKVPGQRVQPHFGVQAERNFGNNGFIRGHTQFQPRPGGNGLSPSVGVSGGFRFRREAEPQGTSLSFQGTQPLSGPMRQPSWDLNANRNIYNNGRTTADVYGGMSKVPGQRVQPHFGVQAERNFGNNGFIRGHTQFQPRPGGNGLSPSVGVSGGFRFRREAEPQGTSLSFQGTQPLSGPMRQPSWDLNANRNIYNNGRTTADIYGGMSKVPGQRAQPHFGIQAERNIGKNGFIRGHTQFQPRPGGNGLSPSGGISAGYRFRREAEPQGTSLSFQGTQPLSGPMRQPSWDLNANRNIYNNGRTTADIYGGMSKVPGQRVQPHFGIQAERNIGKNGFIRGHTQFQPRPGGNGLSPSVGVSGGFRFRREAEPQGTSLSFQGTQPLSGPMRQPSWDLNANRNIYNNGRTTADVYGGMSKVPGQRVQPHFGVQAERNFGNNGFIRGHTQFQPRPGGNGLSPSVGVSGGFRFRREAEPQGTSLSFQGTQPLSGPMRQPSWDLNANRNIYNNGRTTADIYGGMSKVPGQRAQPHFGIQAERNIGKNGFIRGHTQFQPRPGGSGLSPSGSVSGGFRFRRETEDVDEAISAEEY